MRHRISIVLALVLLVMGLSTAMASDKQADIDPKAALAEADLDNGKSLYENGKPLEGPHLTFTAGPHWLRTQEGGCANCHGDDGLGNILPEFCFTSTPPITFKHLAKARPPYTAIILQRTIENGIKPDGYEMDYCMPRWRLSKKAFKDLLGHLISLDKKE